MPKRGIALLWLPPSFGKNYLADVLQETFLVLFTDIVAAVSFTPEHSAPDFSEPDDDVRRREQQHRFPSTTSFPVQEPPECLRQCYKSDHNMKVEASELVEALSVLIHPNSLRNSRVSNQQMLHRCSTLRLLLQTTSLSATFSLNRLPKQKWK